MQDKFGRKIDYLRISLTDRCNLRCIYCMPEKGVPWQPHDQILRIEEIARFVRLAAQQGVRKVRLTGGEPLVRKGVVDLVRDIAATPGIEDVSLTTNGILLPEMARDLKDAGLSRVNISPAAGDVLDGVATVHAHGANREIFRLPLGEVIGIPLLAHYCCTSS